MICPYCKREMKAKHMRVESTGTNGHNGEMVCKDVYACITARKKIKR